MSLKHKKKPFAWLRWTIIISVIIVYLLIIFYEPHRLICDAAIRTKAQEVFRIEAAINSRLKNIVDVSDKDGSETILNTSYKTDDIHQHDTATGFLHTLDVRHCQHAGIVVYKLIALDDELAVMCTKYCPQCHRSEYTDDEYIKWKEADSKVAVKKLIKEHNELLDQLDAWHLWRDWVSHHVIDTMALPIDLLIDIFDKES